MVLEVNVLGASVENGYYVLNYLVENPNGVIRRSRTVYYNNKLSRENDNKELRDKVSSAINTYKLTHF
jgi:hypothetical protein